jgi:hypothetical protein
VTHLGERVSDLVDGQLPPDAVERAHAHLVRCRECRDAVEAERLLKARLASLQGPAPEIDFLGRLMAMAEPGGPVPPRVEHVPGSPRPRTVAVDGRLPVSMDAAVTVERVDRSDRADRASAAAPPRRRRGSTRPAGAPSAAAAVRPNPTGPSRRGPSASARLVQRLGRQASVRRGFTAAVLGALGAVGAGVAVLATASPVSPATVVPVVDSFVVRQATTTARLTVLDLPAAGWQLARISNETTSRRSGASGR